MGFHLCIACLSPLMILLRQLKVLICTDKRPLGHSRIYIDLDSVTPRYMVVIPPCCCLTFLTVQEASWSRKLRCTRMAIAACSSYPLQQLFIQEFFPLAVLLHGIISFLQ